MNACDHKYGDLIIDVVMCVMSMILSFLQTLVFHRLHSDTGRWITREYTRDSVNSNDGAHTTDEVADEVNRDYSHKSDYNIDQGRLAFTKASTRTPMDSADTGEDSQTRHQGQARDRNLIETRCCAPADIFDDSDSDEDDFDGEDEMVELRSMLFRLGGISIQMGSLSGSVLMFVLVEYTSVFDT